MHDEEHDDLWHLLGKAKQPAASPFFSRNVLRAVREPQRKGFGFFVWLRRHWAGAALGACAALVAGFAVLQYDATSDPMGVLAEEVSSSPDYAVISDLDELLASEESAVWLDNVY